MDLSALQANKNLDFQQLFIIFDQLEDMMFLISVDDLLTFRFTHINPAYVRNTGIQLSQIKNKQTEDIFQPNDAHAMNANYQKAIMSKQKLSYEEQLTIGKRQRTYETTIIPIFQEHTGKCLYIVGISRDISQRRKHEEALRLMHKELTDIMRNQQGLVFKVQKHGQDFYFALCDGQLIYELGYTPNDMTGACIKDLFTPDHTAFLYEHYNRCWESQEKIVFEVDYLNKLFWLTSLSPIVENGETVALIGSSIDIKEKKQAEEALMQTEKLALLGELAAGIGHEIRNPLTVIKGFISLMLQDTSFLTPKFIKLIESEIDHINQTAGELMMLAKPQQQQITNVDLHDLLDEVILLLDSEAFKRRVTVQTNYTGNSLLSCGDKHQLKKAFFNLLKNAIESMEEKRGGYVFVSCTESDNNIIVTVRDQGQGIPAEQIDHLGEPFYTTKKKGNGLGLMVTYRVIKNHGGNISCESILSKGTTFTITFSNP